jgi:dTDP-4-amino-4,6-dideoxygalactose transaminase
MGDLRTAPLSDNSFSKFWVDCTSRGPAFAAQMRSTLWRQGVETESLYRPLHLRPEFRECRTVPLPNTEALAPVVFSLPVRADLDPGDWRRIERAVHGLLS